MPPGNESANCEAGSSVFPAEGRKSGTGPPLPHLFGIGLAADPDVWGLSTGWDLPRRAREVESERRIDFETLFDLVKLSFGVIAGTAALVALIVA